MSYFKYTIKAVQITILFAVHLCLNLVLSNMYTVLQTATAFTYILLTIQRNREIKYMCVCLFFMINIVLSIVIWVFESINTYDILIVAIVSWCSILLTLVIDAIYSYCIDNNITFGIFHKKRYRLTRKLDTGGIYCPICLEEGSGVHYITDCGHSYHKPCLDPWLEQNRSCPTCREDLF